MPKDEEALSKEEEELKRENDEIAAKMGKRNIEDEIKKLVEKGITDVIDKVVPDTIHLLGDHNISKSLLSGEAHP